jgi:hypothetical protein
MARQHVVLACATKETTCSNAEKEEKEKISADNEKLWHYAVSLLWAEGAWSVGQQKRVARYQANPAARDMQAWYARATGRNPKTSVVSSQNQISWCAIIKKRINAQTPCAGFMSTFQR